MDFNYGIEHEIAFLNAQGAFADFSNTPFTDFEQIIADLPFYESDYPQLRVGDAGIKLKRWYIEGYERYNDDGISTSCAPKGIEIRTTIHSSIEGAIDELRQSNVLLSKRVEQAGYSPVLTSFNPWQEVFNPMPPLTPFERKRRAASPEKITADIPNVSEHLLSKLDESGIVHVGAEVKPGDILVGKVTPKGETQLTPEEKLLRAIFGEKASDVKDTSARVKSSMFGTVIDVRVFTREGVEKDERAIALEEDALSKVRNDLRDELRVFEEDVYERAEKLVLNKVADGGPAGIKAGSKVTKAYLSDLDRNDWFELRLHNEKADAQLKNLAKLQVEQKKRYEDRLQKQRDKIRRVMIWRQAY